ncbi:MAG: ABC transporter permease [Phycisphaerae bacterium]|nr:ABC transporter permease [Phycisphaerae bacterium]
MTSAAQPPQVISGIDAMRGVGLERARSFWADAWMRVLARRSAQLAIVWVCIVGFFAVFAPIVASSHPLMVTERNAVGDVVARSFPLFAHLTTIDLLLLIGALVGVPWVFLPISLPRSLRLGALVAAAVQSGAIVVGSLLVAAWFADPERSAAIRTWQASPALPWLIASAMGVLTIGVWMWIPTFEQRFARFGAAVLVASITVLCVCERWSSPLVNYDIYEELQTDAASIASTDVVFTIVPWSPDQSRSDCYNVRPGTTLGERVPALIGTPLAPRVYLLGTDTVGRDVASQLMHACRLAISIGLVSTGIAVTIGVTLGALMGYFGGKIDLVLFRVVEIFMAIPVLFLLIVAAGVLPRNTYVMMVIIGCVTWTGAARFTRAEFLKLRSQDFVQSARAVGLPLRSILFRHMLPNGVTPVLVDASFAIAAAILAEATLSYLGLGPDDQASWGKLLSGAMGNDGVFFPWLAIFPGLAIFITVLSYNLLGEALRDAIDPKLRKAAH